MNFYLPADNSLHTAAVAFGPLGGQLDKDCFVILSAVKQIRRICETKSKDPYPFAIENGFFDSASLRSE